MLAPGGITIQQVNSRLLGIDIKSQKTALCHRVPLTRIKDKTSTCPHTCTSEHLLRSWLDDLIQRRSTVRHEKHRHTLQRNVRLIIDNKLNRIPSCRNV